jgi:hypothetical protein
MHRSRTFFTLAGALTALAACSPDSPNPVAPTVSAARATTALSTQGRYILATNSSFGADLADRVAALGGSLERVHASGGIAVVTGISDANASKLASLAGVTEVEPDLAISLDTPVAAAEADAAAPQDAVASQTNPALASRYAWQWNMRLIGADQAWAAGKLGSSSVTAAIIDTGIDYDAYDLNGLVDLTRSTSFVPSDDAITSTYFPGRSVISDYNGHGTNVATQVSSKAVALAGVTSKTTLIGVKVLDATGHGTLSAVLNGVLWAADHGANVANMSLGGGFFKADTAGGPHSGAGRYVGLINKVFNYAARKGTLMVVAAGNDGADFDHNGNFEPTYCSQPQVICVSAVGPTSWDHTGTTPSTFLFAPSPSNSDVPAFYTNYGRSAISVAAPGGNALINSTGGIVVQPWPWGYDIASWVWSFCSKTRIVGFTTAHVPVLTACTAGNRISGFVGTSQATPHVTGLAALLMAEKGTTSPAQIKAAIEQSAVDLGQPGTDPFYGKGRISVSNALGL